MRNRETLKLLDRVLADPELQDDPPLLVDVGASGSLPQEWSAIAAHSVCVAFDADARDFGSSSHQGTPFKKLHLFNCIVSEHDHEDLDFHLTRSPYCSSTLAPDAPHLQDWSFWELFEVERVSRMPTRSLPSVLEELGATYVDWFKTDSQGIDLRLFRSLGPEVMRRVLVADFEPGLIDAYQGEDKLVAVIEFMEGLPFWISDLRIQGARRFGKELTERFRDRLGELRLRTSPGWGEISYINTFSSMAPLTRRDVLLGWVVSTVKGQHGFALELLERGRGLVGEAWFDVLQGHTVATLFPGPRSLKERAIAKAVHVLERL